MTSIKDLQSLIGSLNFKETEKFINQSLVNTLQAFSEFMKIDVNPKQIEEFMKSHTPTASKSTKRSDSSAAWLGFAKEYRSNHKGVSSKEIGKKWNKGIGVSEEEWNHFVTLGNKKKNKEDEKKRNLSTGNAWTGYRHYFARKNEEKPEDERLEKGEITSQASLNWKKIKYTLTEKEIAKYQKIADNIKKEKEILVAKKEAKKEEKKKKKSKEKEKEEDENENEESGSDSEDSGSGSDNEPLE